MHKVQRTIHFDKIERILKVSKTHISQNNAFKTHAKFTMNVSKDACYQNPQVCFDLDFIAKNNAFLQTGSS